MRVKKVFLLCLLAALTAGAPANAQGYAGLGSAATEGVARPDPETRLDFPRDHGPHPDFRIEWWYLTANLTGPDGTEYGVQWTLFRSALAPGEAEGWSSPQIWMGHAAVTTAESHLFAERLARGGIGQAGVRAAPFAACPGRPDTGRWWCESASPARAAKPRRGRRRKCAAWYPAETLLR